MSQANMALGPPDPDRADRFRKRHAVLRSFAMRAIIALVGLGIAACGNAENAGAEEARRLAAQEQQARAATAAPAKMRATPVPGEARVPCTQLIDLAAYRAALGEKEPLELRDVTRTERAASSSCALVRGGKRLSIAEQEARSKQTSRLGVLPGDVVCHITAYCSTLTSPEQFRTTCKPSKGQDDESLGSYACVQTHGVGADDVKVYRLLDDDTRCILQIRGGPSNVNNDLIQKCARTARDTIGPAQIKVAPELHVGSASGTAGTP
jgi:hypothetical protein